MDLPRFLAIPLLVLAWGILLGAPPAGLLLRHHLRRKRDAVLLVLMYTALVPALAISGVSTASQTLNLTVCFLAYAGYCALAPYSLAIPLLALRMPAIMLAYLPIIGAYLFATVGALAMLFLLAQSYPLARQTMRPGLSCDTVGWGVSAATTAGYNVNLYHYWAPFPFIRFLAYSRAVTVAPGAPGPWPGCAEVLQQYDHRQ